MPLRQVFVSVSDPRSVRHTRHDLSELLTVAVCAVLSGVDDFVDIELWAEAKINWLRGIMKLEYGIPSHDTIGRAYYISSLPTDAERIARAVRSHWEVENRLHWCLDVQLNEDQSRVRSGYAANNLAIVRHIVMNLLRLNTTRKTSIKSKCMLAATIDEFRAELFGVMT